MGWSGNDIRQFGSMKEWVNKNFNWEHADGNKTKLLDYAVVNRTTLYAALEFTSAAGETSVWACVTLFRFSKNEFMYKDMSEESGPGYCDCPERILKLLSPTTNLYALEWRKACYTKIAANKAIIMKEGAEFTKGKSIITLIKKHCRNTWLCYMDGAGPYSVSKKWLTFHDYVTIGTAFDRAL